MHVTFSVRLVRARRVSEAANLADRFAGRGQVLLLEIGYAEGLVDRIRWRSGASRVLGRFAHGRRC